jgi:hypothetical protein
MRGVLCNRDGTCCVHRRSMVKKKKIKTVILSLRGRTSNNRSGSTIHVWAEDGTEAEEATTMVSNSCTALVAMSGSVATRD